jgi:hypothetical protein
VFAKFRFSLELLSYRVQVYGVISCTHSQCEAIGRKTQYTDPPFDDDDDVFLRLQHEKNFIILSKAVRVKGARVREQGGSKYIYINIHT